MPPAVKRGPLTINENSGPVLLQDPYRHCVLCPRACGVDRTTGRGFCGESAELRIALAALHWGEEPPVSGKGGSGTVFITGCSLGCSFCQNSQISHKGMGRGVSTGEFVRICLTLEKRGAENINLVTGSHAVPAIVSGLDAARKAGLSIPALWNTSSYESPVSLAMLKDCIAVYLPDLKTLDRNIGACFFKAPDYGEHAAAAILKMMEYRPSAVIIRHLILPGCLESTREVLRWFAEHARGRALLSLMTQYTPRERYGRFLVREECDTALRWLGEFGIEEGFFQDLETGNGWLPDFSRKYSFPFRNGKTPLAETVWHWKYGFVEPTPKPV